ncbi:MAG: DUF4910 domain-containing protein [Chthoniobacterales bacterium]
MKTAGEEMHGLITRLYPICRSITGAGLRETLEIIRELIPIETRHVPTGTKVFDWTVPKEWNIRDAWIKDSTGRRLIDFRKLNLHVVNYSTPIRSRMRFAELQDHLFTDPAHPEWVPYRTSYYTEGWGFCLSENKLHTFRENEEYEVCIDSSLEDGHLTYGELLLKGKQPEEVLVSCHVCHPSLADDNLSGIAVAVELARQLINLPRRYSYRFLFVPGTIGSITWLARNEDVVARIRHGLVLTCLGDRRPITYKRSRRGNTEIDRAVAHVLKVSGDPYEVVDFFPYGYDERQYCSPGFNLPIGCMMRARHGEFPEYHTSADNLQFVHPETLADSLEKILAAIAVLEGDETYLNVKPKCEPQLGRRGLYGAAANQKSDSRQELALLWALNFSDGQHSLLSIAERANLPFAMIKEAAASLVAAGLLVLR